MIALAGEEYLPVTCPDAGVNLGPIVLRASMYSHKISYTATENEILVSNNIELITANFSAAKYTPKETYANPFTYSTECLVT